MYQLAPEDEADGIEVAWEDQQKINTFSKLNNRLGDLRDQLKVKEVRTLRWKVAGLGGG